MTFLQLLHRLCALLSVAILAAGGWMVWAYGRVGDDPLMLWGGLFLLGWSLLGWIPARLLIGRTRDEPPFVRGEGQIIETEDGARLWVESSGEEHAPALIFTHGLGLDSRVWRDAKHQLSNRFRVVVWDLPGHGRSTMPADGRLNLDRMADELTAVMALAHGPCVLVGHAIGGMIVQTLCRRHPELANKAVAGVVLANTTYTDPVRTTRWASLLQALETPLLKPMLRLDIWLSPLVRLMNWQSYLSGMAHLAMRLAAFGSQPSRRLLDQAARLSAAQSPAVQAKGMLAMMDWDATTDLRRIDLDALVFVGGRDKAMSPAAGLYIARALPRAHECRVAFAGHLGPLECASFYDRAIEAFSDDVLTKGAAWADLVRHSPQRFDEGRSWSPAEAPERRPNEGDEPRPLS